MNILASCIGFSPLYMIDRYAVFEPFIQRLSESENSVLAVENLRRVLRVVEILDSLILSYKEFWFELCRRDIMLWRYSSASTNVVNNWLRTGFIQCTHKYIAGPSSADLVGKLWRLVLFPSCQVKFVLALSISVTDIFCVAMMVSFISVLHTNSVQMPNMERLCSFVYQPF